MNKVVPKIFNDDSELVLSETVSFTPSKGLTIHIPTAQESMSIFEFSFIKDEKSSIANAEIKASGNNLVFTLTNFLNSLGAAFSQPFTFHINKEKFEMFIYAISTGEDVICLTISIFRHK